MGNVTSKQGEADGSAVFLRDQTRFSVASVTITNARNKILLHVSPNEYPATRYATRRDAPEDSPVEYIQDPDVSPSSPPAFLLRLNNDDDLIFNFTIVVRQDATRSSALDSLDTVINGLTFIFAATSRDLDNLITKGLHADPNLHKNNPNVQLVGDYSTSGSQSVQFQWIWKWKPPRQSEERVREWRNYCSFVEYDQRNHRLNPLAAFSFWVTNTPRPTSSSKSHTLRVDGGSGRMRIPSAQSMDSRISDSDGAEFVKEVLPLSPAVDSIPEDAASIEPSLSGTTVVRVDVSCQRPGDDVTAVEDGPLFRATMKAMELKTANMRARWKKVLKRAETAFEAQCARNDAISGLMEALREASLSNAHAVQPAMEHYFDKIAKDMLANDRRSTLHLQKMIIDPISKLYQLDIKQADAKKRDFEEESKEYYAFVSRYLGQRQDSLKEKKRIETDSKYQVRRRNFELKRFDYSSYLQDLHGGRKDQEVLSNLTRFADAQTKGFLDTARKIESLLPQLEALNVEVREADKEFQIHRTEREEKRRALEKSAPSFQEPDGSYQGPPSAQFPLESGATAATREQPRAALLGRSVSQSRTVPASTQTAAPAQGSGLSSSPSNKFKGIRDLEERDYVAPVPGDMGLPAQQKKEGLVWALSRPGSHADPMGLNKQAWHKFWIVLDQGKLSEYTNWKQKLDLHMDPIDLRIASVREARNAERRFCFEIVTPQFTRVYQATSEEDMKSWIYTINNALQSAVEGKGSSGPVALDSPSGSVRKDFASALTGKSASQGHRSSYIGNKMVGRHATVGERPQRLQDPNNENSQKLLLRLREAEPANRSCADCNSETKVDWVSINIGAIICIECSGIHRSLGTHVTKVRSLTLDPSTFTPDVIEMLLQLGNRVTNSIWEARLEGSGQQKPTPQSSREQRLRFITAKYADRAFVRPLSAMTNSHLASADETLLASVKRNDVQAVGHALALGGNPNVVDRSRGTHAVFLALVAADPPAPSGSPYGSPTLSSSSNSPPRSAPAATGAAPGSSGSSSSSGPSRKSFPIAELLLLNGADLPPLPAPVPLSRAGRDYMEGKLEARGGGRRPTNASSTAPGMAPPSRGGGGPSSAGLPSPAISSAGPAPSTTAATTVTMVGSAPAATALSPGLVSRQADGKTASPGLPPHHHRNNSYHQHQSLNFQQPAPPQQHHQPPGLDEGGVGVGGDTLTALPAISPGAERRKRLSSGTRLVKQQAPGSLG